MKFYCTECGKELDVIESHGIEINNKYIVEHLCYCKECNIEVILEEEIKKKC